LPSFWKAILFATSIYFLGSVSIHAREENAVPHVDAVLQDKVAQSRGSLVPVLITCEGQCEEIMKALKAAKIQITSTGSLVFGIIGAEITSEELDVLKSIKGISAIEYDEETQILN